MRWSLEGSLPPGSDVLARKVGKAKKVNFAVSGHRACLVLRGRGLRGGRGWCSAFLAVSSWHIWPTCGSHYCSPGLCTAIFTHRMGGGRGGGGRLLRTPASRRGPGPGGVRLCLRPDSGIQLCASNPAFQPQTPPSWPQVPSGLTGTHLRSGTCGSIGAPGRQGRLPRPSDCVTAVMHGPWAFVGTGVTCAQEHASEECICE